MALEENRPHFPGVEVDVKLSVRIFVLEGLKNIRKWVTPVCRRGEAPGISRGRRIGRRKDQPFCLA